MNKICFLLHPKHSCIIIINIVYTKTWLDGQVVRGSGLWTEQISFHKKEPGRNWVMAGVFGKSTSSYWMDVCLGIASAVIRQMLAPIWIDSDTVHDDCTILVSSSTGICIYANDN